jgi:hypothetical protein
MGRIDFRYGSFRPPQRANAVLRGTRSQKVGHRASGEDFSLERRLQDGSVSGMALFGHRTLIAWSDDHRTDQFQARLFLATTTREHWSGTWRNKGTRMWGVGFFTSGVLLAVWQMTWVPPRRVLGSVC